MTDTAENRGGDAGQLVVRVVPDTCGDAGDGGDNCGVVRETETRVIRDGGELVAIRTGVVAGVVGRTSSESTHKRTRSPAVPGQYSAKKSIGWGCHYMPQDGST